MPWKKAQKKVIAGGRLSLHWTADSGRRSRLKTKPKLPSDVYSFGLQRGRWCFLLLVSSKRRVLFIKSLLIIFRYYILRHPLREVSFLYFCFYQNPDSISFMQYRWSEKSFHFLLTRLKIFTITGAFLFPPDYCFCPIVPVAGGSINFIFITSIFYFRIVFL